MTKLFFLSTMFISIMVFANCSFFSKNHHDFAPDRLKNGISPQSLSLVEKTLKNTNILKRFDYHVHILGLGHDSSGIYVNKRMLSLLHPADYVKMRIYLDASGVSDEEHADNEYVRRLVNLLKNNPAYKKVLLLPLDHFYDDDGVIDLEKTQVYVPNEYVFLLAKNYPDHFIAGISVHPYRKDALAELVKWSSKGARIVKWIPNIMGINPSDPRCDQFYKKMVELDLILFSHTGDEHAVFALNQKWGNPLLLQRPLDHGVKVIAAHSASLGKNIDDNHEDHKESSFKLFLRMMDDVKYKDLLFGEISGLTQINRLSEPLTTILERTDLHDRLINGSDYPLPAIDALISTKILAQKGFITSSEQRMLDEIFKFNPLLFDFMVKRTVRHPQTKQQLSSRIFEIHPILSPVRTMNKNL